ncbi:protein STPG3 [Zootoca vivipara]|uniref:protein STPG3 n=1 Tax=Zootoca vivipara TaxID=8524 RepID=UPI00293BD588|nr:protein STPG3 [Zootoca vivipara]
MEFQQKHVKFLAQMYLDTSQKRKPKSQLVFNRHHYLYRGRLSREPSSAVFFPAIKFGKQSSNRTTPEGRLSMAVNTDSPGPAAYSACNVNFRQTSAPSYTFGWKSPSKEGGGRRSWQKSWFLSNNPFFKKVDFSNETNWPSPFHYAQPLDVKPANLPNSPHFTMGQKGEFIFVSKNNMMDPAPNRYNTERAYNRVMFRSPSIIINPPQKTMHRWTRKDTTPGPGTYNVERGHMARLPCSPSFFIQGVRRPKKHETGPFSTL